MLRVLPSYGPDDNKIERTVWQNLLTNVTGNHKCQTMAELTAESTAIWPPSTGRPP